jgi:hypothetical protein
MRFGVSGRRDGVHGTEYRGDHEIREIRPDNWRDYAD